MENEGLRPKPLRILRRKRKSPFGEEEERCCPPARGGPPLAEPQAFADLQAAAQEVEELGVSWGLGVRVRFSSPTPLPCRFRAFEEVSGTVAFARGGAANQPQDVCSRLFQASLVWQHPPPLPGLLPPLFPRTHHPGPPALSPLAQEALHSKWCDSLRSLHQLVRLFQCPFFYACAPHFTALFRCAGAAAFPALHALLAPTTRAMRSQLAREGVSFSMPLAQEEEESSEAAAQDSEGEEWLESLGLSQDAFPLRRTTQDMASRKSKEEGGAASLVLVCGAGEVQALVNFLADAPIVREKSGLLSGLAPTLLAPCAFLGATLTNLQVSAGRLRGEGGRELHSLEVRGPLLPSALHALSLLLPPSPATTTLPHTHLFTQVRGAGVASGAFAATNLADCGMSAEFVRRMCCPPGDAT